MFTRSRVALSTLSLAFIAAISIAQIPDSYALRPITGNTELIRITASPFATTAIGLTGRPALSSLEFRPVSGELYAAGGNQDGGKLYVIDTTTGVATLVGPTGFTSVPGLAFGLDGFQLFGTATIVGAGANTNGLISIDVQTGAATTIGGFGTLGVAPIVGLEDIAVDPVSGTMIALTTSAFDGTPGDVFEISTTTGQATYLGSITQSGSGAVLPNIPAGLAFADAQTLLASLGGGDGRIVSIDLTTMTFTILGDAAAGSISDIAVDHRPAADLGFAKPGSGGIAPRFRAIGNLETAGTAEFTLDQAYPNSTAYILVGVTITPYAVLGGTILPTAPFVFGPYFTDAQGSVSILSGGGGGPFVVIAQWVVFDPGATFGTSLSNGLGILVRP